MSRLPAGLAALAVLATATGAAAHARLIHSDPKAGAVVAAPAVLTLNFSEGIVAAKSSVQVLAGAAPVAVGKLAVDPKTPRTVTVPLPKLAPGAYKVHWSMTTEDTHVMQGDFGFKVK